MLSKVCVIGLGYIGLPTAALLASKGYSVNGVDIQQSVIDTVNAGRIHILEPDLDQFVKNAVESGKLYATLEPDISDVFIIAVPTPFHGDHNPNIDYVLSATQKISSVLKKGDIIILESTSPIGTTEKIAETLSDFGVDINELFIAHCPERVLPGNVMFELVNNDRIIGGLNEESNEKVRLFYETFVKGEVFLTNARTAEMCKLVENSYRDVNISFANELSMICDEANIDVNVLIGMANKHPRVNILNPGPGVGGHCIAVDPWFIVSSFPKYSNLIKQARLINDYKREWVIEKIENAILQFELNNGYLPKIALMGQSFKPDIDDLRESPAVYISTQIFSKYKDTTLVIEPNLGESIKLENYTVTSIQDSIEKADIFVFLVAHKLFRGLNIPSDRIILDFCGVTK